MQKNYIAYNSDTFRVFRYLSLSRKK